MLPLDVSNTRGDAGLDMKTFWYTIYCLIAVFVFLVLPFSLFFYETEGDEIVSLLLYHTPCSAVESGMR